MWNINLDNLEGNFCFDSMILALLKHYGLESKLYLLKKYYSSYISGSGPLAERLKISDETVSAKVLRELIGVELKYRGKKDISDIYSFLISELEKYPVGVFADPFYCSWTPLYKKAHFNHYFLILDIDSRRKHCTCADIYYPGTGLISMPVDELLDLGKWFVSFEAGPPPELTKGEVFRFMNETLFIGHEESINDERLSFMKLLEEKFELSSEIGDISNADTSKLLLKLKIIAGDKNAFIQGLQYVEKKFGLSGLDNVCTDLLASADKFEFLKGFLIKSTIKNRLDMDKLKQIINSIYDLDISITNAMQKILSRNGII
ncbi:hypothetical protein CLHUN_10230 [Ruminiclostridium hungatei]|uniref:Butirosin biosynthesis protein H N-terminal domain-containing protein n=1 Tax=Ruminiclostridium hungatei TaxID=48256 RepID=A0A1V4SNT3_RUMHU|nr:hypothetical protein [Ruminiclostridium hungatei]OPX45136.1 hypothetical protein CLHUN_10230 [Ruminiclostridium hungatei]